ncbi:MAG: ribbon-helix-helix domain-containing protein [Terriglobia bacterium]
MNHIRPRLHFSAIRRMVISITINRSYALMVTMKGRRVLASLYLDPPVHKALRQLSETTRVPTAVYLREAVADLLKKYGVKAPGGRKP